jgi:hypothetical protein
VAEVAANSEDHFTSGCRHARISQPAGRGDAEGLAVAAANTPGRMA